MTPAEFKSLRESMGLTTKWLAARWDVSEYSVQRWESTRTLPEELEKDITGLKESFDHEVRVNASAHADTLIVPRTNKESPRGLPAAWHRAIAQRARETTGVRILYYTDESDIDGDADRTGTSESR